MPKKIVQKNELESLVVYVQEKNPEGKWITTTKMPVYLTYSTQEKFPIYKSITQDGLTSVSIFKPL